MKRASSILLLAFTVALSACDRDPGAPVGLSVGPQVFFTRVDAGIRITNNTDTGVAYVLSNPNWLGLLALCADPGPACVRLAPGASVLVPLDEIYGYSTGATQANFYWWHVVPDGADGYTTADVTSVTVPL